MEDLKASLVKQISDLKSKQNSVDARPLLLLKTHSEQLEKEHEKLRAVLLQGRGGSKNLSAGNSDGASEYVRKLESNADSAVLHQVLK